MRPLAPELARTSPLAPKMTPVIKNDHFLDVIIYKSYSSITDRWQLATPKGMNFREKFQRGGGAIFNPKMYIADFGNFKQGFLIMKLIQNSKLRLLGIFFFND